jgi:hypothetical protein
MVNSMVGDDPIDVQLRGGKRCQEPMKSGYRQAPAALPQQLKALIDQRPG